MSTLLEKSRNQLISQSKQGKRERDGKTRYEKRLKSRVASSNKSYNRLDMNSLFKDGILNLSIDVRGETDNYIVKISYGGFLDALKDELKRNNDELDLRVVIRALVIGFNKNEVYLKCTCPDWCLEENTKIKLLNGEVHTIKDILTKFNNGEDIWVYSTDDKGDFKPGHVTDVWISGYTNELIKITLDNNESIMTTPTHRYMLRDGTYIEANKLKINQSLMPLYFSYHNGYECYKKNSILDKTVFNSVYKQVAESVLSDKIEEAKKRTSDDIIQIHHQDYNKLNNYPSNLIPLGKQEHWKHHYTHLHESGNFEKWQEGGKKYWATEEARKKQSKVAKRVFNEYYSTHSKEEIKSYKEAIGCYSDDWKSKISKSNKKVWANYSEEEYAARCEMNRITNNREEIKKKHSESQKKSYREHPERIEISKQNLLKGIETIKGKPFTISHKENISKSRLARTPDKIQEANRKIALTKIQKVFKVMLENNLNLDEDSYNKAVEIIKKDNKHITTPPYKKYFNSFNDMAEYFNLNHKVKNIEYIHLDSPVPVYDITVENYNNFYVDAGVILHNCYRFHYWATIEKYNNGEPELRPADETNPDNELGAGCKHVLLVLGNTSWIIKASSVIMNYIKYIEQHQPRLYQKIIYPAIYNKQYEEPTQLDITDISDEEPELSSEEQDIDTANIEARKRGQFKTGNQYRIQPKDTIEGQESIEDIEEEE